MRSEVDSQQHVRELIQQTRTRMGDTIEELGERLNPDRIQNEVRTRAKREFRGAKEAARTRVRNMMNDMEDQVGTTGRSIGETIRDNPVPTAMIGVGLAWLMANRRHDAGPEIGRGYTARENVYASPSGYPGAGYTPRYETAAPMQFEADEWGESSRTDEIRNRAREARDRVSESASEAVDSARRSAAETAQRAQHAADDVAHRVQDRARNAARRAELQAHRVEDRVRENPLAAGAVALALGFAAGMAAPETRREHRMMGPARDRLIDQAERKARDAGEAVKHAAERAVKDTAKGAMREMGSETGGTASQRTDIGGTPSNVSPGYSAQPRR